MKRVSLRSILGMDKYFYQNCSYLKGFTLAEVLITLGIIGIISAITLPSVVGNYQKKVFAQGLKKGYTTFSNALNYAISEYGNVDTWDEMVRDPENDKCSMYSSVNEECAKPFVSKYFEILSVIDYKNRAKGIYPIKNLKGGKNAMFVADKNVKWFYLQDGTCFLVAKNYDNYIFSYIFYDVNGDKKPNVLGKDIFVFDFGRVHKWKMAMESGFTDLSSYKKDVKNYITQETRTACSKTNGWDYYNSFSCGALVQYNNWEFPKDYPW